MIHPTCWSLSLAILVLAAPGNAQISPSAGTLYATVVDDVGVEFSFYLLKVNRVQQKATGEIRATSRLADNATRDEYFSFEAICEDDPAHGVRTQIQYRYRDAKAAPTAVVIVNPQQAPSNYQYEPFRLWASACRDMASSAPAPVAQAPTTVLPSAPKPIAALKGSFSVYDNFDIAGGDFRTLKNVELAKCAATCQSDKLCLAYSFDKWNKWCFLKSNTNTLGFDPGSMSAVRRSIDQPQASTAAIRIDRRPGRTFLGSFQRTSSESLTSCEQACQNDEQCHGYSYVNRDNQCRLFNNILTITRDANVRSGLKTQTQQ
jgi:PAN domain